MLSALLIEKVKRKVLSLTFSVGPFQLLEISLSPPALGEPLTLAEALMQPCKHHQLHSLLGALLGFPTPPLQQLLQSAALFCLLL